MSADVVNALIPVAYFAVALVASRFVYSYLMRGGSDSVDMECMFASVFASLFWPLVALIPFVWLLTRWVTGGIRNEHKRAEQRRARVQQLREDARAWEAKRRRGTEAEQKMAAELARVCWDQARELENHA